MCPYQVGCSFNCYFILFLYHLSLTDNSSISMQPLNKETPEGKLLVLIGKFIEHTDPYLIRHHCFQQLLQFFPHPCILAIFVHMNIIQLRISLFPIKLCHTTLCRQFYSLLPRSLIAFTASCSTFSPYRFPRNYFSDYNPANNIAISRLR